MSEASPLFVIEARGVRKSFGPSEVLKGVELSVAAGEVHALLGGNGAGKSTLIKILTSTLRRDAGTILFGRYDIDTRRGEQEMSRGIAVVHQEMALLPDLTVEENIDLPHRRRAMSLVNNRAAHRVAIDALSLIDPRFAKVATKRLVSQLTLHERQLAEIARALSAGAQLLFLDEPTANLTSAETGKLFECLRRLVRESGISIVFVSHRMKEIREIADVCTILRDGVSAISRASIGELTDHDIVAAMGLAQAFAKSSVDRKSVAPRTATRKPSGASFRIEGPQLDLTFEAGSIIGLAGAPAGPSQLIDTLVGVRSNTIYQISRDGLEQAASTPRRAVRSGIGFISGDRANKGLLASLPIIDNMLASRRVAERRKIVSRREYREGLGLIATLKMRGASLWSLPETLSGGTQQKMLIARWIGLNPNLLVLEEPTRGVDIGTKKEIYELVRQMAESGSSVVWWSTENVELVETCDVVIAFDPEGKINEVLRGEEISEGRIIQATGMAA